jgi:hypothetical protein
VIHPTRNHDAYRLQVIAEILIISALTMLFDEKIQKFLRQRVFWSPEGEG